MSLPKCYCHKCGREVTMGDLNELLETIERLESAIDLIRTYRGCDDDALASWKIRSKQQEEEIADLRRERDQLLSELEEVKAQRNTALIAYYRATAQRRTHDSRDEISHRQRTE